MKAPFWYTWTKEKYLQICRSRSKRQQKRIDSNIRAETSADSFRLLDASCYDSISCTIWHFMSYKVYWLAPKCNPQCRIKPFIKPFTIRGLDTYGLTFLHCFDPSWKMVGVAGCGLHQQRSTHTVRTGTLRLPFARDLKVVGPRRWAFSAMVSFETFSAWPRLG